MPSPTVSAYSLQVRNHLVATGRFLALTWNWTLHFNMDGGLKALPVDLGIPARPVAAVKLKNRTVSPVVALFIKHSLELAKSMTSTRSASRAKTA